MQLSFQQMLNDTPIKDVGDAELYGEAGGPQKKTGGADEAKPDGECECVHDSAPGLRCRAGVTRTAADDALVRRVCVRNA